MAENLKLYVIKTGNGVYISDNIQNSNPTYYGSKISSFLFNGVVAEKTYRNDWFKLSNIPTKIERKIPASKINIRYELKAGYPESPLTPKVLTETPFDEDSDYYEVCGLYVQKYELKEEGLESIDFELVVLAEEENFSIIKQDFTPQYSIIDQIMINPVLLPTKPCTISSIQLYPIVRNYIKTYLDGRYAKITSDYDFCFTVQKVIALSKPTQYTVTKESGKGRWKKKWNEIRYNSDKKITIFEMAPKPYNSYPVIEPINGDNYEDLQNKIGEFCKSLIEVINKPLKECSCCEGLGVIIEEDKQIENEQNK